ncbi:MAG: hypothetical protein ACLU4N_14240 [Butyricimonas faecihominis]
MDSRCEWFVVIVTKKPEGRIRVTYKGSLNIEALTYSYDLLDPREIAVRGCRIV